MNKYKQKFTFYLKSRGFSSTMLTVIAICAVIVFNLLISALSGVFPLYLYSPEKTDLSLSESSELAFEKYVKSGEKVTVTFCSYEDAVESHTTGRFVLETARLLEEKYPDFLSLRFVNALTMLDSDGNSVAEELTLYYDGGKNPISETSVIFSSEKSFRVVTDTYSGTGYADFFTLDDKLYITSYNGEEVFVSSVLWTLTESHGTVYMTVGHGETANGTLHNLLTAAGYYVKELDLRKNDVPEDAELVIVSNPISDFERGAEGSSLITEYDRMTAYRDRGGKFAFFLDPEMKRHSVLESFISDFGISFSLSESGERLIVNDRKNAITTDGFTLVSDFADSELSEEMKNVISNRTEGERVILRGVASLSLDESKNARPLLISSPSSVVEAGGSRVDESGSYVIAAYSIYENDLSDPARAFVMSDGMLTASDAVVTDGYCNKDFIFSLLDCFFDGGEMPYGCRSVIYNEQILENLTMGEARTYTAFILAIPVIIAIVGAVILIRRKNR